MPPTMQCQIPRIEPEKLGTVMRHVNDPVGGTRQMPAIEPSSIEGLDDSSRFTTPLRLIGLFDQSIELKLGNLDSFFVFLHLGQQSFGRELNALDTERLLGT
jgi:hypothetical protein